MDSQKWLGQVLERNLGRVSAPDELWDRIMRQRVSQAGRVGLRLAWALAASLALIAALWGSHVRSGAPGVEDRLEVRSSSPREIGAWVKSRTGLDIPFPAELSPLIRLSGACTIKGNAPSVRISYKVSNHDVALTVSGKPGTFSNRGHNFLASGSEEGVTSWFMRGETYTLAYARPDDARVACMLCHANVEHLAIRN